MPSGSPSRGALPLLWLQAPQDLPPMDFMRALLASEEASSSSSGEGARTTPPPPHYNGFSLIIASIEIDSSTGELVQREFSPIFVCFFLSTI